MNAPAGLTAALALGAARLLSATWRFHRVGSPPDPPRDSEAGGPNSRRGSPEPPGSPANPSEGNSAASPSVTACRRAERLPPACYAFWHEHQLPLAIHHRGHDLVVLVSRHRDGEIVARALARLGYATARGSSSRGGSSGLRRMIRAGMAGHGLAFTPDGPRGPARICKSGVVRAAARTGLAVVPVGLAASRGRRLASWDRFLVPGPWSRIYISYGPPLHVPPDLRDGSRAWARRIGAAIDREVERCEHAALGEGGSHARPHTARDRIEARVRSAWRGRPGPALRGAGAAFGIVAEAHHLAYDSGILRAWRASLPIGSVGGLTVGGSGKTPATAELAGWLAERGRRVAILTRGYADELALHRELLPEALVIGDPDRVRAAERAAARGAEVALLDDGFQHRRLARDLDIVLVDLDAILRTNLHRLPAGPFRERFGAVARAHGVIVTRRGPGAEEAARLASWLRRRLPDRPVARLAFEPGQLVPANPAARAVTAPDPAFAVTGIMKPGLFFEQLGRRCPGISARFALADHAAPTAEVVAACLQVGASRGGVCTRKDVPRLTPALPSELPLWYLEDRLRWESGEAEIRQLVERLAGTARAGAGCAS